MQKKIILACTECLSRNYSSNKNAASAERLQINKFCKKCKKHTIHRETK